MWRVKYGLGERNRQPEAADSPGHPFHTPRTPGQVVVRNTAGGTQQEIEIDPRFLLLPPLHERVVPAYFLANALEDLVQSQDGVEAPFVGRKKGVVAAGGFPFVLVAQAGRRIAS